MKTSTLSLPDTFNTKLWCTCTPYLHTY